MPFISFALSFDSIGCSTFPVHIYILTPLYDDGIFQVGKDKFSKTFKFSDINYAVASREDKEAMFLEYSELLNSLDSGATTKITINNRRLNWLDFERTILIPKTGDELDEYREEYNKMLLEKATGANAIVQDKYMTISVNKKNVADARTYFARVGADLIVHFGRLGSKCAELETDERLRIFHDFYRVGEEIILMSVFEGKDRKCMIADIKNVIPHIQDSDMVELAGQVLGKLENMSDAEFAKVALEAAE